MLKWYFQATRCFGILIPLHVAQRAARHDFSAVNSFGTSKRKDAEADVRHETQSLQYFRNETGSDCLMRSPELRSIGFASCFAGRKIRELIDCIALDTHVTRHGVQTRAVTTRAFVCLPL